MAYRYQELRPVDADIPALVPLAFLRRAESLCALADPDLAAVKAAAESLVLEILGWPEATDGARSVARRDYTETIVLDGPAPVLDLARRPVGVSAVSLDGALVDPSLYRVMESIGRIVWRAAWPAPGVEIAVSYAGGWRTPAQEAGEGPVLPGALAEAVLRTSQLIGESAARFDGVTASRADESMDGLGSWSSAWTAGGRAIDDEIRPLVATFVWRA